LSGHRDRLRGCRGTGKVIARVPKGERPQQRRPLSAGCVPSAGMQVNVSGFPKSTAGQDHRVLVHLQQALPLRPRGPLAKTVWGRLRSRVQVAGLVADGGRHGDAAACVFRWLSLPVGLVGGRPGRTRMTSSARRRGGPWFEGTAVPPRRRREPATEAAPYPRPRGNPRTTTSATGRDRFGGARAYDDGATDPQRRRRFEGTPGLAAGTAGMGRRTTALRTVFWQSRSLGRRCGNGLFCRPLRPGRRVTGAETELRVGPGSPSGRGPLGARFTTGAGSRSQSRVVLDPWAPLFGGQGGSPGAPAACYVGWAAEARRATCGIGIFSAGFRGSAWRFHGDGGRPVAGPSGDFLPGARWPPRIFGSDGTVVLETPRGRVPDTRRAVRRCEWGPILARGGRGATPPRDRRRRGGWRNHRAGLQGLGAKGDRRRPPARRFAPAHWMQGRTAWFQAWYRSESEGVARRSDRATVKNRRHGWRQEPRAPRPCPLYAPLPLGRRIHPYMRAGVSHGCRGVRRKKKTKKTQKVIRQKMSGAT